MSSGDDRLDTLIRLTCGRALSLPPLAVEVDLLDEDTEADRVVAAFAEQFAIDVSGVGDNQRNRLSATLGDNTFRAVVATFIADFVPRVWAGCEALDMGRPGHYTVVEWDHESDPVDALLNGFAPAVARLQALDPVTTEIVRLRGATQHNCRLCKSLREGNALDEGGSEEMYAQIERYESAESLTDAHKAALRYVDALIWTPARIEAEVAAGVRRHFSEKQAWELTLDVMRNACNKIAVSLGADTPRVASGTERYSIGGDGQPVYADIA
ncbi:carboxymuconolactone decarboxylase family protein [Mycolicibacterium sp. GF69]|uniref:carboxymuconolactone decarboxylase family protein n=1 Tax=Mycolicibacterium sp. GF69 TaxID=2267251 RepID=UPI000DCE2893|nr:carboxymuconolactone decarboxylase family protein [Mycolicibacterium sp. GF69]RAV12807.1 carboxymuconolactone decarboxylase family protein [Mycolicibacterium sp. GF69]